LAHIQMNLAERMNHYHVPGLSMATIQDGKLESTFCCGTLEAGTDRKVDPATLFNACSISKLAATMLILKWVEQGGLNLDEPVNERLRTWRLPDNEYTLCKSVTLRMLLSHQSGLQDPPDSFAPYNPLLGEPTMPDLLSGRTSYCPQRIEPKAEPGSEFSYSDAGFCVIEQLVEDVSGLSFKLAMKEQLLDPLHMTHSTYDAPVLSGAIANVACGHEKGGNVTSAKYPHYPYAAAAGLWTTPNDLAALTIEIMQALHGGGKLGVSSGLIEDMISPQGGSQWAGLGVFLDHADKRLRFHRSAGESATSAC